jgi:hypothetical protein
VTSFFHHLKATQRGTEMKKVSGKNIDRFIEIAKLILKVWEDINNYLKEGDPDAYDKLNDLYVAFSNLF